MANRYQPPLDFEKALQEEASEYRFVREAQIKNYQLKSPADIGYYLKEHVYVPFEKFTQEELWILLCNTQNVVTHDALVYRGTINSLNVRIAEVFRPAIYYNAVSIVLAHNHPSNSIAPSMADVTVTEAIIKAGQLLDVETLDHVIMTKDNFTSFRALQIGGFNSTDHPVSPPATT